MSKFSIKILFFTVSIIGIFCIPFLSYKLVPDNTYPSLKVSYTWPNASQYSIENKITSKFEGAFATIKNVKEIYSKSYSDQGEIFLEYDKSVDIEKERFHLASIIRQIYSSLPEDVSYPTIFYQRPDNNDVLLLSYSIASDTNNQETKNFIDKILTPQITNNESINSIIFEGIPSDYYEVIYKTNQIKSIGLTEVDIISVLRKALILENLGHVIDGQLSNQQELIIQFNGVNSLNQLYNLPLKKIDSKVIKLKDIASIEKKNSTDINLFRINGENSVSFSITADKSANQITLANSIKKTISEIEKNHSHYNFILTSDSTNFLKTELKSIFFRTLMSFFFLFLFTLLIYRNLTYILVLFSSLVVTISIAIIFFKIFKLDIHIYSLMSLAVSIGFVIDNSIITIDHYSNSGNKKIILPILAATLTTIAPLLFITTLNDTIKLNLIDFSWALIFVLISSLIVSFFFIPSIMKSTKEKAKRIKTKRIKNIIILNAYYLRLIFFLKKYKLAIGIVLVLLFGLPLFLLPTNLKSNSSIATFYNNTYGSEYYLNNIKPHTDTYLGGVLKLFIENSSDQNFINNPKRLGISIRIGTPFGSTISYIDKICNQFEKSLELNKSLGIDFFQTRIYNKRAAQIDIYFEPDKESTDFPFQLKGFLEKESLTMSGVDFSVFGIGKPFGTASGESFDSTIILSGFDYNKLNEYAQLVKSKLEENARIDNVILRSEASWFPDTNKQYVAEVNDYNAKSILNNFYENYSSKTVGYLNTGDQGTLIKLSSNIKDENTSFEISNNQFKLNDSLLYKLQYNFNINLVGVPDNIVKNNQEYQLVLQYQFGGTYKHSEMVRTEIIKQFKNSFVSGFNINDITTNYFSDNDNKLPKMLLVCVFVIFSICSILLESFKKSLLIILIVPVSFIGVFYSLYNLDIGFNQGVYGALILLVGLLVNSSIFIINEFVNYNKKFNSHISYIKAFNKKIIPVIITIVSTIIGLIPYLISDTKNNFWYPFAITICMGLVFSLFVLVFIIPIYLISDKQI